MSVCDPVPEVLFSQWAVPVLRPGSAIDAERTALVLAEEGFRCVELTYSTPDVLRAVRRLCSHDELTIGVGTVTTADQVAAAAAAGARFVVSFANPPDMIPAARQVRIPVIPGAFTPHEVLAAMVQGASAVKVFPAHVLGPGYLRDLRAVLGEVPIMATGGIGADDLHQWSEAGAAAVGIGASLGSVDSLGEQGLREAARRLAAAVARARS